jgi:hypothetical protein
MAAAIEGEFMKSIARKYVVGLMFLAALAITVQLAAQQQPEGLISVDSGIANPVPLINQPLVPDATMPGGPGFTLTVNGTGFVSTSVVNWNGSARTTTFVSTSQLKATILASDIATAGTASVTVANPSPGGGTSNVVFFDVSAPTFPIELNKADYGTGSGSQPDSVGVGDFNGDGKLDLAVADLGSNTVTILLGNGDGTFQVGVDYATQSRPDSVIVGDFNGDGKLDLAVRNDYSNSVSILLGNGDGTFQSALNFSTGNRPYREIAGDFNADGKLDLAITNFNDNTVSILLGNGDGTFQAHRDYPAGPSPVGVATGDFNGDGKLDLAVVNFTGANTVSILLGNGDGTFQAPVPYGTGVAPVYVAVGDFNGDGKLDLAVANHSGNTVSVLLGNGDGTFQPHVDYAVGAGPFMVATADIDADGKLDLAVANQSDGTVSILRGNGDGSFQVANNFFAGSMPSYVALADFNGDGRLDLAVAKLGDNAVAAMLQDGTITLFPASLNFGIQVVGTRSPFRLVTLTNTGSALLNITSITITGNNPTDFSQTNNCGSSLPPGARCTIIVTFTPTQIGPRTAAVTITDNAPGSPHSVALSGTGVVSGPNATLSPTSLTFATQLVNTISPAQPVTLTNYGTMLLDITSIIASGDFSQSNTCGSSLAPLASCTISVTFTPTQRGTRTGTVLITDNAPGSPQTMSLTGVGTVVELNPTSLNFGTVTVGQQSSPKQTTLTNVSNTRLNISSITITGADPGDFSQVNNCGTGIGGHSSCTITVTFTPTQQGARSADVSVSDDGGGSPQQVSLSGTGRSRCGGSCPCPAGCHCVGIILRHCAPNSDLLNESFFDRNPAASFECGGD